jgi:hypothetical protein
MLATRRESSTKSSQSVTPMQAMGLRHWVRGWLPRRLEQYYLRWTMPQKRLIVRRYRHKLKGSLKSSQANLTNCATGFICSLREWQTLNAEGGGGPTARQGHGLSRHLFEL